MKSDFPIFSHHPGMVYLDSAATSQKPQVVIDALTDYYENYNANAHRGIYPISARATKALIDARLTFAKFIGTTQDHIIFTKNTTESINLLARSIPVQDHENIVITEIEHHSNFVPWQQLFNNVKIVRYNKETQQLNSIADQVDEHTKIVSFTGTSNVSGQVQDIVSIAKEIRQKNPNTIIIVDACQYAVHVEINMQELDVDFLAFSAHKLYGPLGVGILYGKNFSQLKPFLYGGDMIKEVTVENTEFADAPHMFEAGTIDVGGVVAAAKAVEYLNEKGRQKIIEHEKELTKYTIEKLQDAGFEIIGHDNENYASIISFYHKTIPALDIAHICAEKNVCIRIGHHCAQPFMKAQGIDATLRVSIALYNDFEDIDHLIDALEQAKRLFTRN